MPCTPRSPSVKLYLHGRSDTPFPREPSAHCRPPPRAQGVAGRSGHRVQGRGLPGPVADACPAWWTSMPRPPTATAPRAGPPQQRGHAGGRRGRRPPVLRAGNPHRPAGLVPPCVMSIPNGVAFTTRSALATSAAVPHPARRPGQRRGPGAASGERFTTTTSAAPAAPRARTTARPAPPLPPRRSAARPRPGPRRAAARPGSRRRRCCPPPAGRPGGTRSSPPQLGRHRRRSSTAPWAAALCGMVTDRPPRPSVRMASTAAAPWPGGTPGPRRPSPPPRRRRRR